VYPCHAGAVQVGHAHDHDGLLVRDKETSRLAALFRLDNNIVRSVATAAGN
jgi:hypothetical protein